MNLEFFKNPSMVWFLIGLFCVISEFSVPGLIIIFFGVGAWIVALTALVIDLNLFSQLILFLFSSVLTLLLLRKRLAIKKRTEIDATDDFIGKIAIAENDFSKERFGKVTFKGASWKAQTSSAETIHQGQYVKIIGYESITLHVEPINKK